jgi:hypothetical protein
MTVSTTYAPLSYSGNGATTAFSVTWPFYSGSLVVTLISSSGVETVRTIVTHYTVAGGTAANGLPATGTVTMLTAPASGETLRITRVTPKTQASTWAENDPFPQKVIEAALDRLTLMMQEAEAAANDGIGGDVMQLVTAGATDYWDAEDQIIRNLATPTGSTDATTKAYVDSVTGTDQAAAAAVSAAAAAASLADFLSLYLGSAAANPTVDGNGDPLAEGMFYWNSAGNELRFYDGANWNAYSPTLGVSSVNGASGAVTLTSTALTMSATSRVVGRKTASGGASEEVTLSELLDFIGSAAQGDILYRGASAWARLAAGTSGQYLQTLGTGANPQWNGDAVRSNTTATLTKGYTATAHDLGTLTTGTTTPDPVNGNLQRYVNGGAHTLAAPTAAGDYTISIQITNNGSAGAITLSGFTKTSGDSLTTVNGDDFLLHLIKHNGFTRCYKEALQ